MQKQFNIRKDILLYIERGQFKIGSVGANLIKGKFIDVTVNDNEAIFFGNNTQGKVNTKPFTKYWNSRERSNHFKNLQPIINGKEMIYFCIGKYNEEQDSLIFKIKDIKPTY